jgi:hypothetical protein
MLGGGVEVLVDQLLVARPPKDGVVRALESHHLEGECFLAEIVWCAEPDWQVDMPEGLDALAQCDTWNGVVLGCS